MTGDKGFAYDLNCVKRNTHGLCTREIQTIKSESYMTSIHKVEIEKKKNIIRAPIAAIYILRPNLHKLISRGN